MFFAFSSDSSLSLSLLILPNDRVTLRHWRRGGDAKPWRIAVGHEDAKKYTGSLTGGEGGTERQGRSLTRNMARSAPIFWEEPVPVPWNFCRYHTVSPSNRYQHLPSPLIYRPVIKFPSINVKRCNRVLVDARRSQANSANPKWKEAFYDPPSSSFCWSLNFCNSPNLKICLVERRQIAYISK